MVRITECASAASVLRYFLESLTQEELKEWKPEKEPGLWLGTLATRLGLRGAVSRETFASMLGNIHPFTGESLTPRTKEGRRSGYELVVSAPKSLSALYALTGDLAVLGAFVASVKELMKLVEEQAKTRVRIGGADEDRATREIAYAAFLQRTARPVNRIVDPHIHAHCFAPNATWDPIEQRYKALQFGDAYTLVPLLEAQFVSILARKVTELGYSIVSKGRFWEIDGVPHSVIAKFSRRTEQIKQAAAERGTFDPKELDQLGAWTRERKVAEPSAADQRAEWASRVTAEEQAAMFHVKDTAEKTRADRGHSNGASRGSASADRDPGRTPPLSQKDRELVAEGLRVTAGKLFERQAVILERVLLDAGLRAAPGRATLEHVREEMEAQGMVTRVIDKQTLVTNREAVNDERRLVDLAVAGKGRYVENPVRDGRPLRGLSEEQAAAVRDILSSPDLVTVIQGRSGVGKTRLTAVAVQEAAGQLGKVVCMLAPTARASRGVLRSEGHKHADTVAKFLTDEGLQGRARNGIVWVDEAGLLSTKEAIRLLETAASLGARVVLMGDSHQHRSVARGDVLQTLDKHAKVRTASVEGVLRQRGAYREMVESLNRGDVAGALAGLDSMRALRVVPRDELFKAVAADYVASRTPGAKVVLVAPTHAECREATQEIRRIMKGEGTLKGGFTYESLVSRGLTEFERGEAASYQPGNVVCFHRKVGSPGRGTFAAHSRWTVLGEDPFGNVVATLGGLTLPQALPLKRATSWDVYNKRPVEFAVGDTVRFTNTAFLHSRLDWALKVAMPSRQEPTHRVDRGAMHTITRISPKGTLTLDNGLVVPPTYGHLAHGYCLTSFAAQGMTADVALGLHSSMSGAAASFRQFYVAMTRGRNAVRMYTDSREELVSAITRREDPSSALSVVEEGVETRWHEARERGAAQQQRDQADGARRAEEQQAERERQREKGRGL